MKITLYHAVLSCFLFLSATPTADAYNVFQAWTPGAGSHAIKLNQNHNGDHLVYISGCSFPNPNGVDTLNTYMALAEWNNVKGTQTLFRTQATPIKCKTSLIFLEDESYSQIFYWKFREGEPIATARRHLAWSHMSQKVYVKTFEVRMSWAYFNDGIYGSLDEYSTCYIGGDFTFKSVMLHELGHALGMAHSQEGRFALMRANDRTSGYYCKKSTNSADNNRSLTLPHPDDLAALRHLYGNNTPTHGLGVMAYRIPTGSKQVGRAAPFGVNEVCAGTPTFQTFGIANLGTVKLKYDRDLIRSANATGNAYDQSLLHAATNRVKSPGPGVFSGRSDYVIDSGDLPPVGEVHFGVMKLKNIRRFSDNVPVNVDRSDILQTHFHQRYMRGSCQ